MPRRPRGPHGFDLRRLSLELGSLFVGRGLLLGDFGGQALRFRQGSLEGLSGRLPVLGLPLPEVKRLLPNGG